MLLRRLLWRLLPVRLLMLLLLLYVLLLVLCLLVLLVVLRLLQIRIERTSQRSISGDFDVFDQSSKKSFWVRGETHWENNTQQQRINSMKHNNSTIAEINASTSTSSLPHQADRKLLMEAGLACLVCPRVRTGSC